MRTVDQITMQADADTIYRIAADVEHWPDILPHYRWVKVLEQSDGGSVIEMAARRGRIPVRWQAIQTVDPANQCIYYCHTGGATRGMDVVWRIEQGTEGVQVMIVHELNFTQPFIRTFIGKWIVGHYFVHYIAGRTLRCMKEFVEQGGGSVCDVRLSQELDQ